MKMRRLSEIDLARIGPLSGEEKLFRLRQLKFGRPPHTYNPLRKSVGDILNVQPEMFAGFGEYTPWGQIEGDITKRSTSESELSFNLGVAKALYNFGVSEGAVSYGKPIAEWVVGYGQAVKYWWNIYTVMREEPYFVFVDPRLNSALNRPAIRFVLSVMNERIRIPEPDFADARLAVCQFPKGVDGERNVRLFDASEFELFDADQMNDMIGETYRLWASVLAERDASERRRTGTTPFGF